MILKRKAGLETGILQFVQQFLGHNVSGEGVLDGCWKKIRIAEKSRLGLMNVKILTKISWAG